jgi:hypothetical protein
LSGFLLTKFDEFGTYIHHTGHVMCSSTHLDPSFIQDAPETAQNWPISPHRKHGHFTEMANPRKGEFWRFFVSSKNSNKLYLK